MTNQPANPPAIGGWILRDLLIAALLSLILWSTWTWIAATGWGIAQGAGAAFGFVAAYMLCYMLHEWGHLAGALLAHSNMPLNHYRSIGIGRFDIAMHSRKQFLALSWGGVAGYVLVMCCTLLFYTSTDLPWVGGGLLVGSVAFVAQSLAVDLPQIWRVQQGADIAQTSAAGANTEIILRRTWQTWTPLAALVVAWNVF